ncbi:DUF1786 domain-containing protein [Selenihalanaerobacter shriftii]|uniref:Uncharacterized protein, DUF1786 family n=1 Tax=Selenihalanaerobacter shriftii TaxID=142842 RepID=A0A1T4KID4_9FIRM|nr:DUF1786 domain-containing protein [Selenihalanaerobacter shriftii]SJZ42202.1 Uncharacterized protein, DUF1786 family [Selenihalanaerobacter shriftii]
MKKENRLLAIDIGAGTQDILLYEFGQVIENCIKLVLPSPTVMKAKEINQATKAGQDIFITGQLMGGGSNSKAIKKHLAEGYNVYALPNPAKTIKDNLEFVKEMGIEIVNEPPEEVNYQEVNFGDLTLKELEDSLANFNIKLPDKYAIAVQDHGEALTESNRKFRFEHWRRFIENGGDIKDLSYLNIPNYLTRMQAAQDIIPEALLMDTGAAAIKGALCDEKVADKQEEGIVVVNIGNLHTLGILVKGEKVWGLFEHHTSLMSPEKLQDYIQRLAINDLTNQEVYDDRGHGAYIDSDLPNIDFDFVAVTGPNRHLANDLGYYFAVPEGDMMLSGCFGLVTAAKEQGLIK